MQMKDKSCNITYTDADSQLKPVPMVNSHAGCLLCGNQNPLSMKLRFFVDQDQVVYATFRPNVLLQGYKGVLHGGVVCALLDSAMVNCLFATGITAVTAQMSVKFTHPVHCSDEIKLRAWVEKSFAPLYNMCSELRCNDEVCATAQAKFMETPQSSS